MPSALSRRLARLEGVRRERKGPCPECGYEPGARVVWNIPPPRIFGEPPDPNDDPSKDICSTCGWKRVWRIPSPKLMGREEDPAAAARR